MSSRTLLNAAKATPRLTLYTGVAGASLVASVASGRPEVATLGVPFAVALVLSLVLVRPVDVSVAMSLEPPDAVEGDEATLEVTVTASQPVSWFEVELAPHPAMVVVGSAMVVGAVSPDEPMVITFALTCARWGVHRPCRVALRSYGHGRLFVREQVAASRAAVRVHPSAERLRALARPSRLLALTGAHVSRERGDGIEFVDTRPFVPGDRVRAVNWRSSARRGELWVNQRNPDRNTDVVLFLDTFAAAAGEGSASTLDLAVEAAIALARRHIAANDRVGLVGLGGVLRWLPPGMGTAHVHRIVAAVLDSEVIASEADKGVDVIPVRGLPPRAMVIALTPLLDRRAVALMVELRARGFDLVVIECSPLGYLPPPEDDGDVIAVQLWLLEREVVRDQLRAAGAALVEWQRGTPFAQVLEEVAAWRRLPRRARV